MLRGANVIAETFAGPRIGNHECSKASFAVPTDCASYHRWRFADVHWTTGTLIPGIKRQGIFCVRYSRL
jgi:hypothetical protein